MSMTSKVHISLLCCNKNKKNKHFNCKPTLENECELKIFKTCSVYLRVRPFWIYTTVSFFIIFFPLPVCVLKIFSILKKKHCKPIYDDVINRNSSYTCAYYI